MERSLLLPPQEIDGILAACGSKPAAQNAERRIHNRWPYPVIQWLAPYDVGDLPKKHMFHEVRCHDLAQGGISFFLPRPPQFHHAVIGLGKEPKISYVLVRILRCTEHAGARKEYLVGACFLQRILIFD